MPREFIEQFLRDKTATQIRLAIQDEKENVMKTNRTGADYIRSLLGLDYLFKYLEKIGEKTVLDCGAGNTLGITQISKSLLAGDIIFDATVLRKIDSAIEQNLGREHTFRTPIETFTALADKQYGAILALNSLAYSSAPELAIASIDKHLVRGGVIKATFIKKQYWHHLEGWNTHDAFSEQLSQLGYDLAIAPNDADKKIDVLVAVKSGGITSASEILEKDRDNWATDFEVLKNQFDGDD